MSEKTLQEGQDAETRDVRDSYPPAPPRPDLPFGGVSAAVSSVVPAAGAAPATPSTPAAPSAPAAPATSAAPAAPATGAPAARKGGDKADLRGLLGGKVTIVDLPRLEGQEEGHTYSIASDGMPLPPAGAAYIVRDARGDNPAVVAYMDGFGRVFKAAGIVDMPPATRPDLQFVRLRPGDAPVPEGCSANGLVEVRGASGAPVRAGEFLARTVEPAAGSGEALQDALLGGLSRFVGSLRDVVARREERRTTYELRNMRVKLGIEARGLSLCKACAIAYVALCELPSQAGISLKVVGAREVLGCLRGKDPLEAARQIMSAVDEAMRHPLTVLPGPVQMIDSELRSLGVGDLKPADFAPGGSLDVSTMVIPGPDGLETIDLSSLSEIGEMLGLPPITLRGVPGGQEGGDPASPASPATPAAPGQPSEQGKTTVSGSCDARDGRGGSSRGRATGTQDPSAGHGITGIPGLPGFSPIPGLTILPGPSGMRGGAPGAPGAPGGLPSLPGLPGLSGLSGLPGGVPGAPGGPGTPGTVQIFHIRIPQSQLPGSASDSVRNRGRQGAGTSPFGMAALPSGLIDLAHIPFDKVLQSIASHDGQGEGLDFGKLMANLLGEISSDPKLRLSRTHDYAKQFCVDFDRSELSAAGVRLLLRLESLYNRFLAVVTALDAMGPTCSAAATLGQALELDAWNTDRVLEEAWPYLDGGRADLVPAVEEGCQLDMRAAFARGIESVKTPFRVEYRYRFEPAGGTLVVDIACPSGQCMPASGWSRQEGCRVDLTPAERAGIATRFVAHMAPVAAAVGFWAGPQVKTVVVNCWYDEGERLSLPETFLSAQVTLGGPTCMLSAEFDRDRFRGALDSPEAREAACLDPFGFLSAFRHVYALDGDRGLRPVRPLFSIDAPALIPEDYDRQPEDDDREFPEPVAQALHVTRVSDLAVFEDVARKAAGAEVAQALTSSGDLAALTVLRDVHDRTENPLVHAACLRVSEGIANGRLTAEAPQAVVDAIVDIYGFDAALARARDALREGPAEACAILDDMLTEADTNLWFVDTSTRTYRYFDSYASRVVYGARCSQDDGGREVRLCADGYYMCHYRLSSMLSSTIEGGETAIAHARRCVELAPSVAGGYLRLARCYFAMFDYTSEIATLKDMLRVTWNPADASIALYWMGYAYWMCDRRDLAAACYQRAVRFDASSAEIVSAEVADLARKGGEQPQTLSRAEEDHLLAEAGIPVLAVEENVRTIVVAAGGAVEIGAYELARGLLGSASLMMRDDALLPVLDSLDVAGASRDWTVGE